MLSKQEKLRLLRKSLGEPKIEKSGRAEYVFLCPFCRHYKPKLSVNVETDIYNCWTCPEQNQTRGRRLTKLLRLGCTPDEVASYVATLPQEGLRLSQPAAQQRREVRLPVEFEPLVEATDVLARGFHRYARMRGLDEGLMALYRVGVCRSGRLANRIVFPSFDGEGELNFYTGRSVDPGGSYMTCDASKDVVFNEWLVDWSRPVVVVEGPFDAVAAGTNAIPLQGKVMLRALFSAITARCSRVYLALDNDARDQQLKIASDLHRYQLEVMTVDMDGKDPSELGAARFREALERARPYDETDRMRGRLAAYQSSVL